MLPYWGEWPICTVRPSDIDDWVARLSKTMRPQSVRTCYGLLRGPLRSAVRDRVITDPCIDIVLPKLPDITKTFDDVLTADEVNRLVAAMRDDSSSYAALRTNHRYQALVFMGAWLGPRWSEAIGSRICDVKPLQREVIFGRQVINQNGTHTFAEVGSKTGDWRTVPVPVPQPVMDALTAHIVRYRDGAAREDLVFTNAREGHILRGNFSRDALAPAIKRPVLDGRRVTWLTLRHTAASLMFDAGFTLFKVQHRRGHKSPTLTAKVYTHLMRERFEEVVAVWRRTWPPSACARSKLADDQATNMRRGDPPPAPVGVAEAADSARLEQLVASSVSSPAGVGGDPHGRP